MNLLFYEKAWEDYWYWQENDKKITRKINEFLKAIARGPHSGIGKPEPLRHAYSGYWSRRITDAHRMVYRVDEGIIKVVQLRLHY
jgi:toxin YoeB